MYRMMAKEEEERKRNQKIDPFKVPFPKFRLFHANGDDGYILAAADDEY